MKKALEAAVLAAVLAYATAAHATPSTVVWTPATTYTQPFLVPHITYDTYFGEQSLLPVDVGLTMGFVPNNKFVEGEVGVDGFYSMFPSQVKEDGTGGAMESKNAFQLNGKLSLKEGSLHEYAPGLSAGIMSVGLTKDLNDYNVLYAVIGKTIGAFGTVAAGGYQGNDRLLLKKYNPASGTPDKKDATGFLASYASPKFAVNRVGLKDVSFGVDYQSGENALGALGAAVSLYFTDTVSLLTGPVYFNNRYSSGTQPLVWTAQLDVDLDFTPSKK
jgi:hypothetical protein